MNIFLHVINLFFISVLESKQSLVQSFDTACTKSKCTQSSRGLGCSYQKLYHIRGEQSHWLVATITDQCSGLPQSQKNTVLQKGTEMHLGSKKKTDALYRHHSISHSIWTCGHVNKDFEFAMAHPNVWMLTLWSYQEWETSRSCVETPAQLWSEFFHPA